MCVCRSDGSSGTTRDNELLHSSRNEFYSCGSYDVAFSFHVRVINYDHCRTEKNETRWIEQNKKDSTKSLRRLETCFELTLSVVNLFHYSAGYYVMKYSDHLLGVKLARFYFPPKKKKTRPSRQTNPLPWIFSYIHRSILIRGLTSVFTTASGGKRASEEPS